MKSIMEEASSISKAIDQAWNRAGKPVEFSIKILEQPERNMFGITVKSAKIAFFFDERKATVAATPAPAIEQKPRIVPPQQPQRHEEHRPRQQQQQLSQRAPEPVRQPAVQVKPAAQKPKEITTSEQQQRTPRWNDEMVATASQWLTDTLKVMGKSDIPFSSSTSGNNITFQFSQSITGDQSKDRLLFSGFANLIMATLRNKYKKSFRFNKVILIVT